VPAYNVEKYVGACLRSISREIDGRRDIEVIVVVDGATDGTQRIVEDWASRHPETAIRIIVQENAGLSSARNRGIAASDAEYLAFLDADDIWLDGYVEAITAAISQHAPDIIEYDAILVGEGGTPEGSLKISSGTGGSMEPRSADDFLRIFRCYAWARVYHARLFDAIYFPVGRRFEDTSTTPWLYKACDRIISIGVPLVGYTQRKDSILRSPTVSDVEDLVWAYHRAMESFSSSNDDYWLEVAARIFQQACSRTEALPFRTWHGLSRLLRKTRGKMPSDRASIARKIQFRLPLAYIAILFVKRRSFDRIVRALPGISRTGASR
jgi:glycosyltransferase involved in cell wall biosynthesis